jgi:hypothetical protein
MRSISTFVRVAVVAAIAAVTAAACGGGGRNGGGLTVTSQVIADPTTQNLRVVAPEAEGKWPVVMALNVL